MRMANTTDEQAQLRRRLNRAEGPLEGQERKSELTRDGGRVPFIAPVIPILGRYLPKHNRRFGVPAARGADVHRPVPLDTDLGSILCIREERVVRNDGTVVFEGGLYQATEPRRTGKVTVERRVDGSLRFPARGRPLACEKIEARPPRKRLVRAPKRQTEKYTRSYNPWRQFIARFYSRHTLQKMKRDLVSV